MPESDPLREDHLTSDEVASYLDARMSAADRRRADGHLADCDVCRTEVLEVRAMIHSAPKVQRSRRTLFTWVGAAAAALLLIAVPWPDARRSTGGSDSVRLAERAVVPDGQRDSVQVVFPRPDAIVRPESIAIAWRRGTGDAQFMVTLMNARGDIRWTARTRDSAITVPDSVALPSATPYILYVDALRSDGTSARSGLRSFTIRR